MALRDCWAAVDAAVPAKVDRGRWTIDGAVLPVRCYEGYLPPNTWPNNHRPMLGACWRDLGTSPPARKFFDGEQWRAF